jgi:ribonuclease E
VNPDIKLPKVTNEKEEIETTDEMDNSRRKRRRSSANIE